VQSYTLFSVWANFAVSISHYSDGDRTLFHHRWNNVTDMAESSYKSTGIIMMQRKQKRPYQKLDKVFLLFKMN